MAELSYENQLSIRSTGRAMQALDNVVSELRASGRVKFRGRKVTKEAVVNAVWLWLAELDPVALEDVMIEFVPKLEALLTGSEGDPDPQPPPSHVITGVPVAVRDETELAERQAREATRPVKVRPKKAEGKKPKPKGET